MLGGGVNAAVVSWDCVVGLIHYLKVGPWTLLELLGVMLLMFNVLRLRRPMEWECRLSLSFFSLLLALGALRQNLLLSNGLGDLNSWFVRPRTPTTTTCRTFPCHLRGRPHCHRLHFRVLLSLLQTHIASLCWNIESTGPFSNSRLISLVDRLGGQGLAREGVDAYVLALLREVSPSVDRGTVGCRGTLVLAARVRLLWSEVFQLHVKTFYKKLSSLQIETIRVFLDEEIPCFLLEIDDVLVFYGLDQLLQKLLLELLEFPLVRRRESHTCLWEAPNVSNLDLIAALLEPLFGLALHVEDLLLHG
jgi:hypothetical protein